MKEAATSAAPGGHGTEEVSPLELTAALADLAAGDSGAAGRVMPLVYARLHLLARSYLDQEAAGHTLQPTALVNEAYLKLLGPRGLPRLESRAHFFAIASRAMRQILVDHARTKKRLKRGGPDRRGVPLATLEVPAPAELDLAELDDALMRLAVAEPLGARITEMRFFGGMEMNDIATVLDITNRTARRHWVFAKAWLCRELTDGRLSGGDAP